VAVTISFVNPSSVSKWIMKLILKTSIYFSFNNLFAPSLTELSLLSRFNEESSHESVRSVDLNDSPHLLIIEDFRFAFCYLGYSFFLIVGDIYYYDYYLNEKSCSSLLLI